MQHQAGETSPYEVRCPRCSVSFPVGTRSCLHCGGRVGRGAPLREEPIGPVLDETGVEEDGELAVPSAARRIGSISLWVIVALGAALSRLCAEG